MCTHVLLQFIQMMFKFNIAYLLSAVHINIKAKTWSASNRVYIFRFHPQLFIINKWSSTFIYLMLFILFELFPLFRFVHLRFIKMCCCLFIHFVPVFVNVWTNLNVIWMKRSKILLKKFHRNVQKSSLFYFFLNFLLSHF
jgi:hypothetical protein